MCMHVSVRLGNIECFNFSTGKPEEHSIITLGFVCADVSIAQA